MIRAEERLARLEEIVQRLIEAQAQFEQRLTRLEETVQRLAEAQAQFEQRLARLEEAQIRTEERLARLEEAYIRIAEEVRQLTEALRQMERRLEGIQSNQRGRELEERYRTRPHRFDSLVGDPEIVEPAEVARLLRAAREAGRLTPGEAYELGETDVIVRGRPLRGQGTVYLAVEVSATIDTDDVERAQERARLLERALRRGRRRLQVWAVVAGPQMRARAMAQARALGVWWLKDGRALAPDQIPTAAPESEP